MAEKHGPFKFKHGWIPVGGGGGEKKGPRSADKLAAGVTGRERVPGPQGYTGNDVARLGSGAKIGDGKPARLNDPAGPHIGDGSNPGVAHTTHSVAPQPISAHDALVEHPDGAKDLGPTSMSPQALDAAVRQQLEGAKAGEHISLQTAKGRARFVKAMTVAAMASSLAGFGGGVVGDNTSPPDVGLYTREDNSDFKTTLGRGSGFTFGELPAVDYGTGQRKKTIIT